MICLIVVGRCVKVDETSATVRCHYLTDGNINFAFTIRRSEYFIPAGLLLKCFLEVSDCELYDRLVGAAPKVEFESQIILLQRALHCEYLLACYAHLVSSGSC